jgi:hypothetical protein
MLLKQVFKICSIEGDKMPELKVLLLFYIEEAAFLAYLGLALIGIRLPFKKVAIIAVLHGLGVYAVRSFYVLMNIPFGTHTIILLCIFIILLKTIGKVRWGTAAIGALLSFIILILSEAFILPPVYDGLSLSLEKVLSQGWLNIIMGYVITLVVAVKKITLVQITDESVNS